MHGLSLTCILCMQWSLTQTEHLPQWLRWAREGCLEAQLPPSQSPLGISQCRRTNLPVLLSHRTLRPHPLPHPQLHFRGILGCHHISVSHPKETEMEAAELPGTPLWLILVIVAGVLFVLVIIACIICKSKRDRAWTLGVGLVIAVIIAIVVIKIKKSKGDPVSTMEMWLQSVSTDWGLYVNLYSNIRKDICKKNSLDCGCRWPFVVHIQLCDGVQLCYPWHIFPFLLRRTTFKSFILWMSSLITSQLCLQVYIYATNSLFHTQKQCWSLRQCQK
jgi:hypothetical protein